MDDPKRTYERMTPEKKEQLRAWNKLRAEVGTVKTIARKLNVSPGCVERHLEKIRQEET